MGRAVDARDEPGPERTCVVTRRKGSPDEMLRFVASPDGKVVPDIARRLPGRGVWLTASAKILAKALATKAFSKAFRGKAEAPSSLPEDVDILLEADALQWLSLANKAGLVVAGFAKVEAALARDSVVALISATNAGADGVEKLRRAARRCPLAPPAGVAPIGIFNSAQLDLALGRPNVIHAAITSGPAAEALLARSWRLARYRGLAWAEPASNESSLDDAPVQGALSIEQSNGPGPGIANE